MTYNDSEIPEYIALNKKFWDHIVRPAYRCVLCDNYYDDIDMIYFDSVEEMEEHIMRYHTGDEVMEFIYEYDNYRTHTSRLRLFSDSLEENEKEEDKNE